MPPARDTRPPYQKIAAALRDLIMRGELKPGEKLASTVDFIEKHGAGSGTIQRAQGVLKEEGFLHSRSGAGVYVRDRQPFVVEAAAFIPTADGRFRYDLVAVETVTPPADIAEGLRLAPGVTAVLRRRVLLHDGLPVELSASYYPTEIAAGTSLVKSAKIRSGAPQVLADLGFPQRSFVDRISARPPTTEEVELLDLPEGTPVLRQLRVIYSDNDRPVEASVLIKGGHRFELQYRQTILI
ncbi:MULTISPECIES: GntR family transcriptional regulator [unclassified Crossiella]|uniref:GntR family transcriptional regulator n=1 Tax=unclassified Crossiella TaxID=2620835 RepID=UPI001FFF4AE3|nr:MULTISPECIES: GntR family transcriptional regulator [unclassified Crossiella]MCK2245267.1 GntR family transcriptional regulator [Crossiella sp. S99.2]MCK2258920.1 GntR family transcriptional regulator [Crossiella sp. S99.1]